VDGHVLVGDRPNPHITFLSEKIYELTRLCLDGENVLEYRGCNHRCDRLSREF
jgi:hypothetical protein